MLQHKSTDLKKPRKSDIMVEHTEFGVLVSYEDWEDLQEQLHSTASQEEVADLRKENASLREVLNRMTIFLSAGDHQ